MAMFVFFAAQAWAFIVAANFHLVLDSKLSFLSKRIGSLGWKLDSE